MSQSGKVLQTAGRNSIPLSGLNENLIRLVTPVSFSTLGIAGVANLVDSNGNVYQLPAGYIVKSVVIKPTSPLVSGGSATISLGLNATSATTDATLLTALAFASVNLGVYTSQVVATGTPIVGSASQRFVVITAGVAALSSGSLDVILDVVKVV